MNLINLLKAALANEIVMTIISGLAVAFIGWVCYTTWLRLFKYPKVLVHEAGIKDDPTKAPHYFFKVINNSDKPITLTHLWIKQTGGRDIHLLNPQRVLPYTLEPTKVWENWIAKAEVKDRKRVFDNVRVRLSDGRTLISKFHKDVPPIGYISGDPITISGSTTTINSSDYFVTK